MPSRLKYIKEYAFYQCISLREVEFTGNELLEIQRRAFDNCTYLNDIINMPTNLVDKDNPSTAEVEISIETRRCVRVNTTPLNFIISFLSY